MPKTHCKRGHPYEGENLIINRAGYRECLACRRLARRRHKQSPHIRRETIERVLTALREGKTIHEVTGLSGRRYVGGWIVDRPRLNLFIAAQPKLGAWILKTSRANGKAAFHAKRRKIVSSAIRINRGAGAHAEIMAATAGLPDFLREEVRSLMLLAAVEGRLRPAEARARVREFVAAHHKQDRHSVMNRWGNLSLDAPITGEDGTLSRINFIRDDQRLWG